MGLVHDAKGGNKAPAWLSVAGWQGIRLTVKRKWRTDDGFFDDNFVRAIRVDGVELERRRFFGMSVCTTEEDSLPRGLDAIERCRLRGGIV